LKTQIEGMPTKVHMIAVCGTGMGALALLFREAGVRVTGSDLQAYPPMGDLLYKAGVNITLGYRPENLPEDVEYVVVGNAVSKDNPEVEAARLRGVPWGSFPETLSRYFLAQRRPVVVVGTHGKTTSTALLAWLLEAAGQAPGFLVGGEPNNFGVSSRLGQGPFFVLEGDEYDSAFFNKIPKFLHYQPQTALFTSLEYDHADIYPDLASLKKQFLDFAALLPPDGFMLVCHEYPRAVEIARKARCRVETYGYGKDADWQGVLQPIPGQGHEMAVFFQGTQIGTFPLPMAGRHNGLNILGSIALLHHLGIPFDVLNTGLAGFLGVRRRQEVVGEKDNILFMDDFAHHPTAVRETLQAVRMQFPDRRILAVFEPRTHTSRRSIFQNEYVEAFQHADLALCSAVFRAETVAPEERFQPDSWVADLMEKGKDAFYFEEQAALVRFLVETCRPGDVVLFMSSGDNINIINELIDKLKVNY